MNTQFAVVRVGIEVVREDSEYLPFSFRMFHCRQRDQGDDRHCPVSMWASEEVSNMYSASELPGLRRLRIGEAARYWVHMCMVGETDYWGEYDSRLTILKCRRIR